MSDLFIVQQRKELIELLGFETRNKYEIFDRNGVPVMFCAETQSGILGALLRMFVGHWRSFELHFFDMKRQLLFKAHHPFRFIFQRLDVRDNSGKFMGCVEWKWGIFKKKFVIYDFLTKKRLKIESGIFSFWTFPVLDGGREVAKIQKKWSGVLKEIFTDADNFRVEIHADFTESQKQVLLAAAMLVDLQYFERKAD